MGKSRRQREPAAGDEAARKHGSDRLSLAVTLVVTAGVAIFLGYLVGQYAIAYLTGPLGKVASIEQAPTEQTPAAPSKAPGDSAQTPVAGDTAASLPQDQAVFFVQVGAFEDPTHAEKFALALRDKGFPVRVVTGGTTRVQVGPYSDRARTEDVQSELKAGYQIVDSFIVAR